jgi:O-antigen ligase
MILASRPVAQWIYPAQELSIVDLEKGNPIDRSILSILIIIALFILLKRRLDWARILRGNSWLLLWFLYCGISILWSDYQGVALKRWIRAIGSLIMILVVLTEPVPVESIKAIVRRCAYVLIPLSIVLIKYYPEFGVSYGYWTGGEMLVGVTTDKNGLGRLCLICGICFIWSIATIKHNKSVSAKKKEIFVNSFFLFLISWLLIKSGSATSFGSFIIGCGIFIGLGMPVIKRNVKNIGNFIFLAFFIVLILQSLFNVTELFTRSLGRDMTFTERTYIWKDLLNLGTDPLMGTGYDSLWLGERLETIWEKYRGLNEAHNGYLEIYLELGVIGLFLFIGFLISIYRKIRRSLIVNFDYGRFRAAFFLIFLLYNVTEAAYKGTNFMYFAFLLIALEHPQPSDLEVPRGTKAIGI